jgi:primosomal protein N' (replication factor Y)
LPEIALSDAFLARFEARFGAAPAVWHSALSPAQRRKTWRGVASGQTRIVIGARSALFLPFQRLKLIIVDEEHDGAFKQEDNVFYNARDMAVLRAFMNRIAVILISATPSLETVHNVLEGRYERAVLMERYGEAVLPHMHMIDMRAQKMPRSQFLSEPLREALAQNFQRGKQSLLFLNRRGYAPLTLCRSCGHRYECPQCSAWLVDHRKGRSYGTLSCHHCGFSGGAPKACQHCGAEDSLVPCGPGVERIAEEVAEVFPQMRGLILSSDMKEQEDDLFSALEKIRQGAVDIIIGTQIIAKGHHFPNLTCVGVVDADLGMKGGDLRAAEHTWQLLQQVSGRAGRGEDQGHVYIQSYMPDNRLMQTLLSHDRDGFLSIEMDERKMAFMPPFARLGALIISGKDEEKTALHARALAQWVSALVAAAQGQDIRVLGPAQAPIYMLRGRYRYRFLVQADKALNLQDLMQKWVRSVKAPSDVKVQIDIDPLSFL